VSGNALLGVHTPPVNARFSEAQPKAGQLRIQMRDAVLDSVPDTYGLSGSLFQV
jgi:hypothetical protein